MNIELIQEEMDENLYLDLCPLLPTERLNSNSNLPRYPFPQNQSTFMEDIPSNSFATLLDSVFVSPLNSNVITNPNPASPILNPSYSVSLSSSNVGLRLDPHDFAPAPVLQHRRRGRDTMLGPDVGQNSHRGISGLQATPTMLIPVANLVMGSGASRVSSRDSFQDYAPLRLQRQVEEFRANVASVTVAGTGMHHHDTSPETLMNNILALEASRRGKLKAAGNVNEKVEVGACNCGSNFECNICFETSVEPVVTPCGHLFCWRCLYKWISIQLSGVSECPVCKGEVTENNLTPIYGRGGSSSAPLPAPGEVVEEIPPRPTGRRAESARQLMRRQREIRGRGVGSQDVERVRMDLEAVLARLRQMPRSNRGGTSDAASGAAEDFLRTAVAVHYPRLFEGGSAGEGREEGDGLNNGPGSSAAGEMHVRRRRRYR